MSLSTLTGTAGLVVGLLIGGAVAVGTTLTAWNWRAGQVEDLKLENERFKSSAIIANDKAEKAQKDSQIAVDQLLKLMVDDQKMYEEKFNAINQQVKEVASATKRAINAATVRLLNDGPSPSRAQANKDPLTILGLTAGKPPADPTRSAADDGSGASELELSRWVNFARCSHVRQKSLTDFLQGAIRAAPQCFEVVDDGGPDYSEETALICARR
jgi:hypothetical protein